MLFIFPLRNISWGMSAKDFSEYADAVLNTRTRYASSGTASLYSPKSCQPTPSDIANEPGVEDEQSICINILMRMKL